jgi:hypothetical protein
MFQRDSFQPSALIVVKRARPSTLLGPGSLVRLASGGPVGIVTSLNANDEAGVRWLTTPAHESVLPDVCLVGAAR